MQGAKWGFAGIPFSKTQIALALAAFGAAAQAAPVGLEFQVNSYTTNNQRFAATAMDQDGDFVVVWASYGPDGSQYGIFAQRYNNTGSPQGSEFQVNSFTTGHQGFPDAAVAMDQDGDFVVAWSGLGPAGAGDHVYARRYNAAGVAQGPEFRVNSTTTGSSSFPSVAMQQDGDFVVSWIGPEGDGFKYGIFAQRYDATGAPQGSELTVQAPVVQITFQLTAPSAAMDQDGDFIVVWGQSFDVRAQRYDAAGAPQGSQFTVNSVTAGQQGDSVVAIDQDGDFVVAWTSIDSFNNNDVYARRFNAAGVAQDVEFLVHGSTTDVQAGPAVAMQLDGDFVIAWTGFPDGNETGVFARSFSAEGAAQGGEFPVNTHTTGFQADPTIAIDQDGDFVVAWESSSATQDGSLAGIYAQRFTPTSGPSQVNSRFAAPQISGRSTSNTPVPEGLAGTYQFTSKFCLNAGADLTDLFSRTKQLTNGNSLISRTRDAATPPPGGAGSEQDFPLNLGYADGVLSASECVDVLYGIGLANKSSFTFRVDLYGNEVQ